MSLENGKCPNCGGALWFDSSQERAVCKFCGTEISTRQAAERIIVDGIVTFDALLLAAQQAMEIEKDFDKAASKYKQALAIKPNDYRVLWGLFICETLGIAWSVSRKGFVQYPGDVEKNVESAIRRFAEPACMYASLDTRRYYESEINRMKSEFEETIDTGDKKNAKQGCYIATSVFGDYNCPQVWVLRRYRDQCLKSHWYGRCAVKFYYFFSPKLIRLFGKRQGFNRFWKQCLTKKVERLKNEGYSDTPYQDNRRKL